MRCAGLLRTCWRLKVSIGEGGKKEADRISDLRFQRGKRNTD